MTKQEQDIFFSVIRASIWQKDIDVDIPVGFQWKPVLQAYADHAILAVVADKILALPEDRQPSKEQKKLIMWYVASNIKTHNQLNIALVDAFKKLEAAGCHPVLLKGQGLATLYPNTQMRGCGDIDIYVGEEEYQIAKQVINEYCGEEAVKNATEDIHHYSITRGEVIYEIHSRLNDKDSFCKWEKTWLKWSECDKVRILEHDFYVSDRYHNCLYIFDHLYRHFRDEGVGFRQFIDWFFVLQNNQSVFCENFRKEVKRYSDLNAWEIMQGVLAYQFGMKASDLPLWNEKKALKSQNSFLNTIFELCNMGTSHKEKRKLLDNEHRGLRKEFHFWKIHFQNASYIYEFDWKLGLRWTCKVSISRCTHIFNRYILKNNT